MNRFNYGVFILFKRQFKAPKRTERSLSKKLPMQWSFQRFKIDLEYFPKKRAENGEFNDDLNEGVLANFKGQNQTNLIRNRLPRIVIIKRFETHQLYI